MYNTRRNFLATTFHVTTASSLLAQAPIKPFRFPKCRIVPQADQCSAFELDDNETVCWRFGANYPRPYFYPFNGPSGASLVRMGHPGAPDHDHHQAIWFAHHDVGGTSFWANRPGSGTIRQKDWLCYEDHDPYAIMAVRLGWYATNPQREIMEQTLVAINRPEAGNEHSLELQSTFRAINAPVKLGKTNFGFLAVRVAKSLSAFFGGGSITNAAGRSGEPAIFGNRAAWVDYSGPVRAGVTEGITFFDHPTNPRWPTHWHVRSDGWMGAAFCLQESLTIEPSTPLKLRYLLYSHRGEADPQTNTQMLAKFTSYPQMEIVKSSDSHRQFEARALPVAKQ